MVCCVAQFFQRRLSLTSVYLMFACPKELFIHLHVYTNPGVADVLHEFAVTVRNWEA